MGASKIEWTDATWNPIVGCSIVSPGCTHCYAMRMAARLIAMAGDRDVNVHYDRTLHNVKGKPVWTGVVKQAPGHIMLAPLHWKKPRRIFVNSMGDLFHESVPDEWIDRVFAVMALCPQHTFQVLTKRAERMREYCSALKQGKCNVINAARELGGSASAVLARVAMIEDQPVSIRPIPNVWLGVSAERQAEADERIPELLNTPAAVRFVSLEPLLGPIDLRMIKWNERTWLDVVAREWPERFPLNRGLDWVIVGGESGPSARPMHPDWVRSLRDECASAAVPFFFKQVGEWAWCGPHNRQAVIGPNGIEPQRNQMLIEGPRDGKLLVTRVGKKTAGRLLDGREWNDMPEVSA